MLNNSVTTWRCHCKVENPIFQKGLVYFPSAGLLILQDQGFVLSFSAISLSSF